MAEFYGVDVIGTSYFETGRNRIINLSQINVSYKTEDEFPIYQFIEILNKKMKEKKNYHIQMKEKMLKTHLIKENQNLYQQTMIQVEKRLIQNNFKEALELLNSVKTT